MTQESDFEYIGWVPCVSGRLFFDYTECGLGKQVHVDINHVEPAASGNGYQRYVIISSVVDWKDSNDKDSTGEYHVIFCGEKHSDEIDLKGKIYLIPLKSTKAISDNAVAQLISLKKQSQSEEDVGHLYNSLTTFLDDNLKDIYGVSYIVESPGFAKLKYILAGTELDKDDTHKFTVMRQAYYYIKYSLHKHRHHHDKAESLTTIHSLDTEKTKLGIKLLNDLRKSLVQIKRDSDDFDCDNLFRAGGISSYAKSLAESCYRSGYLTVDEYRSESSYFDNINTSVGIMADASTRELTKSVKISNNARSVVLFLFTIVAPLIIIYREHILSQIDHNEIPLVAHILSNIFTSDFKIFIVTVALILFYFVYVGVNKKFGRFLLAFKWYRNYINGFILEKYKANIMASIITALSLLLIFYVLFFLLL